MATIISEHYALTSMVGENLAGFIQPGQRSVAGRQRSSLLALLNGLA